MLQVRTMIPGPQEFLDDVGLMRALTLWALTGKIENLDVERLFALFRKCVGGGKVSVVDRLAPAGFMGQMRAVHNVCGGGDPSAITRADVSSAPTKVNKKKDTRGKKFSTCSPAMLYTLDRIKDRKRHGIHKTRQDLT